MNNFPKLSINTAELIDEVERLLEKARETKEEFGAVNWGHLCIMDIEYRLSMMHPDNGPSCVVHIEEASPDSSLARWISNQLDDNRFPNTYVVCEW